MHKEQKNNWLQDHRRKVASQFGEDGVIEKIFEVIGAKNKWCVEFGAGDGKQNSNTWNLINNKEWRAVLIEANRSEFEKLGKRYSGAENVFAFNALVESSGRNSLDAILSRTEIPRDFDFLSIDIDGYDYWVWNSVKKYSPRVVIIEFNRSISADFEFVQPKDEKIRSGSSLLSLKKLGESKGYNLIYVYAANAIFIKNELYPRFYNEEKSINELWEAGFSNAERKYFQLYDGSIVLIGGSSERLLRKKKIRFAPIWVLNEDCLDGVFPRYERAPVRALKNTVKNSAIYPMFMKILKRLRKLTNFA